MPYGGYDQGPHESSPQEKQQHVQSLQIQRINQEYGLQTTAADYRWGPDPAGAWQESIALADYQRRGQDAAVDREAAANLGPPPPTPTLDAQRAREQATLGTYGEQVAAARFDREAAETSADDRGTPLLDAEARTRVQAEAAYQPGRGSCRDSHP